MPSHSQAFPSQPSNTDEKRLSRGKVGFRSTVLRSDAGFTQVLEYPSASRELRLLSQRVGNGTAAILMAMESFVKDVLVHLARIILESLGFFTTGRAYDRPTLDRRRACENFRSAS
jgi:hypothetical protein